VNDDLRYTRQDWGPEFLGVHERGPRVLPRDFKVDLAAFTSNLGTETQADLTALKKFEAEERSPETVKTILAEHSLMPLYKVFSDHGFYDFEKAPITNSLLASVDRDVSYFLMDQKLKWQRPRPTQLDATLTTVVPVPKHSSYPSGHAAQSYASALLLAEIDPVRAEQYKALAMDVAHRREVAGVHYPSDSVAGRMLAEQVVAAMLKNTEIQKRLELAMKEFAAAH
jgi:acid phosphatase (class A)